jgi:hypothetical protein
MFTPGESPSPEENTIARGNLEDAASDAAIPVNDPMSASARLRVTINGHINLGSGTVIDSRVGRTFIVTCGHIFRDHNEGSKIEVDLFSNGAPQTFVGTLVRYDLEADVGLISVPTDIVMSSVSLALPAFVLNRSDRVACIGCSGGNDPSREQLTVTAINKYTGPDNIECTGTPVQGRSGGGLFSTDGELIGVCIAADQEANRGLYAHAFAIHRLLDECNLAYLYQPQPEVSQEPVFAAAEAPPAEPLSDEGFEAFATAASSEPPTTVTDPATDAFAGAMADVAAGDAEVVVIIRPRGQPNAPSRVVIINQASQKFFSYLNGELDQGAQNVAASRTATPPATLERTTQTIDPPSPPRRGTAQR